MNHKKLVINLLTTIFIGLPLGTMADSYNNFYVKGDSLSDQGNLFSAILSLTGSGVPADDHYFEGRFSNGEVYCGLLAEKLGLVLSATSMGGTNFAYGGTRTTYNLVEDPPSPGGFTPGLFPWTLNLQRDAFVSAGIFDPDALYIVWSGNNDVGDIIGRTIVEGFAATKPFSDQAVQGIKRVIEAYIAAGARDILVPNMPDLGLVPRVFNRDPLPIPGVPPTLVADTATALAERFNQDLAAMLEEFDEVNIIPFDSFSLFREVIGNPAAFGLSNVTGFCYTGFVGPAGPDDTVCPNPEDFLFYDNEHFTTAFHAILADKMLAFMATDILEDLGRQVTGLGLHRGIDNALHAKLNAAAAALAAADAEAEATSVLGAFVNLVKAQRGKKIPTVEADALVDRARQLISLIEAI